jgi:hypothetical protein
MIFYENPFNGSGVTIIVFLDIVYHPIFLFKTTFRRLDFVSVFNWYLLNWAQTIELVHISGERDCFHRLGPTE